MQVPAKSVDVGVQACVHVLLSENIFVSLWVMVSGGRARAQRFQPTCTCEKAHE